MKLIAVLIVPVQSLAPAQPLPQPKPTGPGGSCPHGYTASGSFCVPSQGAQDAIPLPLNGVPLGMDSQRQLLLAQRQRALIHRAADRGSSGPGPDQTHQRASSRAGEASGSPAGPTGPGRRRQEAFGSTPDPCFGHRSANRCQDRARTGEMVEQETRVTDFLAAAARLFRLRSRASRWRR